MLFSRVLRFLPVEGVETFSVLSGAFGVDWNSAFRAVVLSGSEASLPGVETAMSIEFASGTGPASAIVTDREWIRWNEVFTPVPGAEE